MLMRALADMTVIVFPEQLLGQVLQISHKNYEFFLFQSSMHPPQNKLPQDEHYFGWQTTFLQIGQSNSSPPRVGNLSLGYPVVVIFVDLLMK